MGKIEITKITTIKTAYVFLYITVLLHSVSCIVFLLSPLLLCSFSFVIVSFIFYVLLCNWFLYNFILICIVFLCLFLRVTPCIMLLYSVGKKIIIQITLTLDLLKLVAWQRLVASGALLNRRHCLL